MKSKKHTRHAGNRAPRPAGSPWQAFLRRIFAAGLGSLPLCDPLPHGALTERSHSFCPVPGSLAQPSSASPPGRQPQRARPGTSARHKREKQRRNRTGTGQKRFRNSLACSETYGALAQRLAEVLAEVPTEVLAVVLPLVLPLVLAGATPGLRPSWRVQGAVPARGRSAGLALGQGRDSPLAKAGARPFSRGRSEEGWSASQKRARRQARHMGQTRGQEAGQMFPDVSKTFLNHSASPPQGPRRTSSRASSSASTS